MSSFRTRREERGYILLVLLLMIALLSIASLKLVQDFKFQWQRDQEQELIHRGVQYSRAVKKYYKKFGRYPTRIEDLENTNNLRFLRRRYKDPITGKDFKLLHLTDVQMSFGGTPPGTPVSDVASQQQGAPGALGNNNTPAASSFGPSAIASQQQSPPTDAPSDVSQADQTVANDAQALQTRSIAISGAQSAQAPQPLSQQLGANGAPRVFGGGAIVGVASLSKAKTIRQFNKKDHYYQWQFIYDPTMDRGGLLMTPNQPPLMGAAPNLQQNGAGVNPGFGNNPGLGNNPGFGNNPGIGNGQNNQMNSSPEPQNPGMIQQQQ